MSLPDLEYCCPQSLQEALSIAADHPDARYLAGGTDLLPQIRTGSRSLGMAIDVKRISQLAGIRELVDGSVAIGATSTVAEVASHPLVRSRYSVLTECCLSLGSYPLRNRATVAGNICNASPCADTSAALLALDAMITAQSLSGQRHIPMVKFFTAPGQTALRKHELVTEIILPKETAGGYGYLGRIARRRSVDISTAAVLLSVLPDNQLRHRVSLLSVAPTPLRVFEAENILDQHGPDGAGQAAELAMNAANPISDLRGSAEYRREMVGVLLRRAVQELSNRSDR